LFVSVFKVSSEKRVDDVALENLDIKFQNGASGVQRLLSQIGFAMSELSVSFATDADFNNGSYISGNRFRAEMREVLVDRRQNEFGEFISSAFLVDTSKPGYVYELTGTFSADTFFGNNFVSDTYTKEFWLSQTLYGETFQIFPSDTFSLSGKESLSVELLPVAYRQRDATRHLLVMLLDVSAIAKKYGVSGIYSADGKCIFSEENVPVLGETEIFGENGAVSDGMLLRFFDRQNGDICITKVISDSEIKSVKTNHGVGLEYLVAIFVVLVLVLSVVLSAKISVDFFRMFGILEKNAAVKSKFANGITGFKEACEAVAMVCSPENRALHEPGNKESVLNSLFLQSKVRDVYVSVEDIEGKVDLSRPFFVAYFRVNYKAEFEKYMDDDMGKATFFLKQLLEMYMESLAISGTVFQVEKDAIVLVFDAGEGSVTAEETVDVILQKLSNESEYAFFTVVVSEIYSGIEKIKNIYDKLIEFANFGKPLAETQVLHEGDCAGGTSRFYFSVEEMGKLSALLQNGTEDEVVRKIDEIFDYNIKKDINRFELSLLCTEIINCGIKLMNRVFHTIPQDIDVTSAYKQLDRAHTVEEYRGICVDLLLEIISYIRQNKREDDYIISYILDYVENHYAEDIYLNLFAEKLKLTGAYISSYFKEKMNVNLSDYVNNYRIKKALELSENPQNKNKDIAVMVGLPNINTFIRLFKKYTGHTPGEYRKKHFGE
ncbi:MAG: helix-turn-helix domain-containing protein, partial [Oscillospiraceae bacterium]|nr:helix-turn-helix domain-containing protein [Oscillospiraceae bacterium]